MPDVSGVAPTAAATLPAALPSFFAAVVIMPSVDSSGLSFFAIEDYSSARRWAADLNRTGQNVKSVTTPDGSTGSCSNRQHEYCEALAAVTLKVCELIKT